VQIETTMPTSVHDYGGAVAGGNDCAGGNGARGYRLLDEVESTDRG